MQKLRNSQFPDFSGGQLGQIQKDQRVLMGRDVPSISDSINTNLILPVVNFVKDCDNILLRGINATVDAITGVSDRLTRLTTDFTGLSNNVGTISNNLETLTNRVDQMNTDTGGLQTKVGQLEATSTGLRTDVDTLKGNVTGLRTDVDELKKLKIYLHRFKTGKITLQPFETKMWQCAVAGVTGDDTILVDFMKYHPAEAPAHKIMTKGFPYANDNFRMSITNVTNAPVTLNDPVMRITIIKNSSQYPVWPQIMPVNP